MALPRRPFRLEEDDAVPLAVGERDEAVVQSTANDATVCKLAAASRGYFEDPFLQYFVKTPMRKPPIINRGYYARVRAIERVVSLFLEQTASAPTRQILNLGGGFDTTFLKLKQQEKVDNLVFVEVDFPPVIQHKFSILKHARATRELLALDSVDTYQTNFGFSIGSLKLVAANLKDAAELLRLLQAAGVAGDAPTLVITECVLVYMEQQHQQQLVQSLKGMFEDLLWVSYDMINPDDEFGRMMRRNLSAAGFRLPGLLAYPSSRHQEERFKQAGFQVCRSMDMHRIFHEFIPQDDIPRINRLEMLDELEEWTMLMQHYCITLAALGSASASVLSSAATTTGLDVTES